MPSTRIQGQALLIEGCRLLCRAFGTYWSKIRPNLTPEEQLAGDALKVACEAFDLLFPLDS